MKWMFTKNSIHRFESEKKIDYDTFIDALLGDLYMTVNPRVSIDDEAEFIEFVYKHFPPSSKAWKYIRKVIALKYYLSNKNEFIAVIERGRTMDSVIYKERADVEYNPDYIQITSMVLPYIISKGEKIFVLIRESASDMAGYVTLAGGHIRYKDDYFSSALREVSEEFGLNKKCFRLDTEGIPLNFTTKCNEWNISYYHIGKCHMCETKAEYLKQVTMEHGKNIVLLSTVEDDIRDKYNKPIKIYHDINELNCDTWLRHVLNIYYNNKR